MAARFDGVDPEPRPIIPSGHMPNSTSLPFSLFLKTNDVPPSFSSISAPTYTTVLPPAEIRAAFESAVGPDVAAAVIRKERPVVVTCGSGMTAGTIWLGLQLLGIDKMGFYDEVSVEDDVSTREVGANRGYSHGRVMSSTGESTSKLEWSGVSSGLLCSITVAC